MYFSPLYTLIAYAITPKDLGLQLGLVMTL
jgi:hypothetical protein